MTSLTPGETLASFDEIYARVPAEQEEGEQDGEARDTLIIEAGEAEDTYIATFDMDSIRAYRERETWGNAYRRPRLYKALTYEEAHPLFVRPDATR